LGSEERETVRNELFRVIDLKATGQNIRRLMKDKGITVRNLQQFYGFEAPQAIYKWINGQALPNLDNLYALAGLFRIPIDEILVAKGMEIPMKEVEI